MESACTATLEAIRGLARTMRGQGAALRAEADALLARAEAAPWTGLAADAMRGRVRGAGRLRCGTPRRWPTTRPKRWTGTPTRWTGSRR